MVLGRCLCNFIKFLHEVNTKKIAENINPTLKCKGINVSIILIGLPETMQHSDYGYEPYVAYIRAAAKEGVKAFYILARGRLNCFIAEEVAWQAAREKIVKQTDEYRDEIIYEGKQVEVLCIRLENISPTYDPFEEYFPQSC
ncbi:MAG: hypothetical protein QXI91_04825 [Candidatus Bathyarchaeia archaeon]